MEGEAKVLRRMARVHGELAIVARARGEEALAQSHERAVKLIEEQAHEVEAEYAADRFLPGGGERT
jgi:ribosomal protein S2